MKVLYVISIFLISKTLCADFALTDRPRNPNEKNQKPDEAEANVPVLERENEGFVNVDDRYVEAAADEDLAVDKEKALNDEQECTDDVNKDCKVGNYLKQIENSAPKLTLKQLLDPRKFIKIEKTTSKFNSRSQPSTSARKERPVFNQATPSYSGSRSDNAAVSVSVKYSGTEYPTARFPDLFNKISDSFASIMKRHLQKQILQKFYIAFFTDFFEAMEDVWEICVVSESRSFFDLSISHGNKQNIPLLQASLDSVPLIRLASNSPIIIIVNSPEEVTHALQVLRKQFPTNFILVFCVEETRKDLIPKDITEWFDFYIFIPTILRRGRTEMAILVYEVCAYCEAGKHKIRLVNSWNEKINFSKKFLMKQSFKGNFFGSELRYVTTKVTVPPVVTYEKLPDGKEKFGGSSISLLDAAAKHLNFTYKFLFEVSSGVRKNGTWYGGLGHVMNNSADFTIPLSLYYDRFQDFAYTNLVAMDVVVVISKSPSLIPSWQQLASPFTLPVWLCVFAVLVLTACAWHAVRIIEDKMNQRTKSLRVLYVLDSFFSVWTIFCWESWNRNHPNRSVFVLMGTWMIASFVIVSCYQGTLVSHLLTPVYSEKPINSIHDLVERSIHWTASPGTNIDFMFKNHEKLNDLKSPTPPVGKFFQTYQSIDRSNAVVYVRNIASVIQIGFEDVNSKSKLYVSSGSYFILPTMWFFRKDAPYFESFNSFTTRIFEAGIYHKFLADERFKVRMKKHLKPKVTSTETKQHLMTMKHFFGGMILLGSGMLIACIVFICELAVAKYQRTSK